MQRFWNKVNVVDEGCWLWTASKAEGYGLFWFDGRLVKAHRFAHELVNGEIPEGYEVDHLCEVRACVRPDHLEAVTKQENMRRRLNAQAKKVTCPKGHPYSGENLYVAPQGDRHCRTCRRANKQRSRERT